MPATQATSQFVVTYQPMATTARFAMTVRGIQHLYYALLFSGPKYRSHATKWRRWLAMGFGVNIREHPRVADRADRLRYNSVSNGPRIEMPVLAANDAVLTSLQELLAEVETVRQAVHGKDEDERWQALSASPGITDRLLDPVTRSLEADGLSKAEADAFLAALRVDLLVLTGDTVISIATEPAPAPRPSVLPGGRR